MATQCRAKNPKSCRVHGKGGAVAQLEKEANRDARLGNMTLYLNTRETIDTLTDDSEISGFLKPESTKSENIFQKLKSGLHLG